MQLSFCQNFLFDGIVELFLRLDSVIRIFMDFLKENLTKRMSVSF